MIKAVIIDDVQKAIILLRGLLKEYCPEVKVVGEAENAEEAISMIESHRPQLVFLDIEMSGKSGFNLLEEIKGRNFHVIFVTAHSEFAIKAFRFSVTDYLLKPVSADELKQAVTKVQNLIPLTASYMQTLRIPTTTEAVFVNIQSIIRLEAEGHYTHIYLENGKHYMSSYHLKQFEEHLDPNLFRRIQRSHLINREKIKSVVDKKGLLIEMADGTIIEVSRRSKKATLEILGQITINSKDTSC